MAKDDEKAHAAFTAARAEQENTMWNQPSFGPPWCVLGLIDAALGRKQEALREGKRAVELVPVKKDAVTGSVMIKYLAMTAAWAGDNDLAFEQLAIAIRPPSYIGYGELNSFPGGTRCAATRASKKLSPRLRRDSACVGGRRVELRNP